MDPARAAAATGPHVTGPHATGPHVTGQHATGPARTGPSAGPGGPAGDAPRTRPGGPAGHAPPTADGPPPSVARFFHRGALPVMPRRQADRDRVLAYVASRTLPVDDPLTEPELTERLAHLTRDPVGLRRALVDAGLVTRTRDGAEYWRTRVTEFDAL